MIRVINYFDLKNTLLYIDNMTEQSKATISDWQEDDDSIFKDYTVVPKDGNDAGVRVVRIRIRQAEADVGGSILTFESESDISDLQSNLREVAMNIVKTASGIEISTPVEEEDRGVTFRGVRMMSYVPKAAPCNTMGI